MQTPDVLIIGGGIVGASIAYHLTIAGQKNVLILERESHQGKGSTGKSMGGVRAQFSTPVNIQMSLYAIPFYSSFEERLGHPCGYRAQGYLFLATNRSHLDYLTANQKTQKSLGLKNVEMIATDDLRKDYPQLRTDDVLAASFCSTDGFVDPYSAMTGFTAVAVENGAKILRGTEVTSIERDGKDFLVRTSKGDFTAPVVVNAAGPWAAEIAKMVGIDLPVKPLRRMLIPTEPFSDFPHTSPMIIDMSNGFHFRPEALGFLLAWNDPEENTFGYNTGFDSGFIEKVLTRAADRVPCFENLAVNPKRCWAGLYEMTPDHHAILGPVPEVPGFFLANGFSGHGVMHAPATGKIISDLILKGQTEIADAHKLRLSRFAEGDLIHETALL
jgi:glycine/D-amino acid oxidase-like deaminating enzyme